MDQKRIDTGKGGSFKVEKTSYSKAVIESSLTLDGLFGIGALIDAVVAAGGYISFGRTGDGGAILLRVLDGPDKLTSYCSSRQEVLEAFEALKERYKKTYKEPGGAGHLAAVK